MKKTLAYYQRMITIGIGLFLLFLANGFFSFPVNSPQALAQTEEDDETPPYIYNVRITEVTASSSIITWETDEYADSLINYGLDKEYGIIRDPRADKREHMIILENLLPETQYYFRLTSTDGEGNQGISSDFNFKTEGKQPVKEADQEELGEEVGKGEQEGEGKEQGLEGEQGKAIDITDEGEGGLDQQGLEQLLEAIEKITSEEVIEIVQEALRKQAEEIAQPPIIILDTALLEIGTDYAIIYWETDKPSNSMVGLVDEGAFIEGIDDPYVYNVGEPDELVTEHTVEVRGLTPATSYHFQVSSEDEIGLVGKSKDRTFRTKSIAPEIYNIHLSKIEEESATINWTTNVPCSSIVEYTNMITNVTKLEGNSSFLTVHRMQLSNLTFDTYYSFIIKVESEDGEKAESAPITFLTIKDEAPPVISKVTTESTLYPGSDNKVQTIASWVTDEPSQCQLYYHQGLFSADEPQSLLKEEDYGTRHVQVVTNFLPSTVYKFWIICNDEAENIAQSEDFTMLTPTQEESIIDIIIKNFESSFGWVKKLGI